MKILIVNTHDIQGGAARAAYRLHRALLKYEIDSKMIVQSKISDDYTVVGPESKFDKLVSKLRPKLDELPVNRYKNRTKTHFSPNWLRSSGIIDIINNLKPDIVHLHWINDGMIRIEDLAKIEAPLVWTLHDMWPFTGGCHYSEACSNYQASCGSCVVLGSSKEYDLSKKVFERKKKTYKKIENVTIVGLSEWLNESSKSSSLLKNMNHNNLPNLIDERVFKPFDREKARELWSLPIKKKLILFGAMGATSDPRKGYKELSNAQSQIKSNNDVELVVFGSSGSNQSQTDGFKINYVGKLYDDISLVTLYSAVDVLIAPSLQENLSNVIMESLACGTPVVAFNIGGNSDLIDHKLNGYLAKPNDTLDLANGVNYALDNVNIELLSNNSRYKVLKEFSEEVVVKQYIKMYQKIIKFKGNT